MSREHDITASGSVDLLRCELKRCATALIDIHRMLQIAGIQDGEIRSRIKHVIDRMLAAEAAERKAGAERDQWFRIAADRSGLESARIINEQRLKISALESQIFELARVSAQS